MKPILIAAALALSPLQVLAHDAAPPKENALTYLKQARDAFKPYVYVEKNGKKELDTRRVIEQHAAVFALLERAVSLPLRFERGGPDPTAQQVSFAGLREAGRLLAMRATVQQESGDSAGALRSGLLCVALGMKAQEDGMMGVSLTGYAVEAIGLRSITDLAPKWDAATLKDAARGLGEAEAKRTPFGRVLAGELELSLEETRRMLQEQDLAVEGYDKPTQERILAAMREVAEEDDALVGRPFALTRGVALLEEDPDEEEEEEDIPANLLPGPDFDARAWAEVMHKLIRPIKYSTLFNRTRIQAQIALTQTALAARAYKMGHGALPKSLQVLVPEYLQAVPDDPFEVGASLLLKDDAEGFRIYSIGPDGLDDGGKAIESVDENGKPTPRPVVAVKSQGDILAPAELLKS